MPAGESNAARRLAVILHADVVGSTALVRRDEQLAHRRMAEVFERLSSTVAAYGGRAHEVRGDALVAGFERASDAVCAALAFQAAGRASLPPSSEEIRPELRIGISLGEDVIAGGTVTGPGVVAAHRVEAFAGTGGVAITAAVRDTVPERFPFEYSSLGRQELKGFVEPIHVYRVRVADEGRIPPPEPRLEPSSGRSPAPGARWLLGGGFAVALAVAAGLVWWTQGSRWASTDPTGLTIREKPSIAVLPFRNLSGDPQQTYFSDGITNDLITDLSRFSDLLVIASNSVFTYKGRAVKVRDVGRELGVRYVLEGSVQRGGDRVRVNAQLIDSTTDQHLWAQRYDESFESVLDLQAKLTTEIVSRLAVRMTEIERDRSLEKRPDKLEAYDLVLQARALIGTLKRADNFEARELLRRAIEIDPGYAAAYTGLGWTYLRTMQYGWTDAARAAVERATELAGEGLQLDPASVDGHRLLARVYEMQREYDLALIELERAIALNPNDAQSHAEQGITLVYSGRPAGAIRSFEVALRVDPNMSPEYLMHLGIAYYLDSRMEPAVGVLERAVRQAPDNVFARIPLAAAYARLPRLDKARREAQAVMRLDPFFELEDYGLLFRREADRQAIIAGLRAAGM